MRQYLLLLLLIVCLLLTGCGSSGNCNLNFGATIPAPGPTPSPEPDPSPKPDPSPDPSPSPSPSPSPKDFVVEGIVINPVLDAPVGRPVPMVEVGYYNSSDEFQFLGYTNDLGTFNVTMKGLPGDVINIFFRKLGYSKDIGYGYTFDTLSLYLDSECKPIYDKDNPIFAYLNICGYEDISIESKTLLDLSTANIQGSYATFSPDEKYLYVSDYEVSNPTTNTPNPANKKLARIKMDTIYSATPEVEYIIGEYSNGTLYSYNQPRGITFSKDGDTLYLSEWGTNSRVIKFTGLNSDPVNEYAGNIKAYSCFVLAGSTNGNATGAGNIAKFNNLAQMVLVDSDSAKDDVLYVTDAYNHCIKKIEGVSAATSSNEVTVSKVAGTTQGSLDGPVATAQLNHPYSIAITKDQNTIYIGEVTGVKLRKLTSIKEPTNSKIITLAGSTIGDIPVTYGAEPILGKDAQFRLVFGIALSADEDIIFISDCGTDYYSYRNSRIKKVTGLKNAGEDSDSSSKVLVSLFAGTGVNKITDGINNSIELGSAGGLLLNADNTALYFFERYNKKLRVIHPFETPEP